MEIAFAAGRVGESENMEGWTGNFEDAQGIVVLLSEVIQLGLLEKDTLPDDDTEESEEAALARYNRQSRVLLGIG